MKFLRYGAKGQERPALMHEDGTIRDLSDHVSDFEGASVSIEVLNRLSALDASNLPVLDAGQRIGSVVKDTPNFFCIGLNYAQHAEETNSRIPVEPLLFNKATSALCGPYDDIPVPVGSTQLDWEVELGFVIGRECAHVSTADALSYVAGYFSANDVSERVFQKSRGGQFVKGKSGTNFGPIGPFLVTPDEVPNPNNLKVTTKVNGELRQNNSTSDMIFSVAEIISNLSQYMTLRVGDVVITGTPEGVGLGMKPEPVFLNKGDVVECEVEGLGSTKQTVV